MNNENETAGSRALLRIGCIFIAIILLTRKQNNNMIIVNEETKTKKTPSERRIHIVQIEITQ